MKIGYDLIGADDRTSIEIIRSHCEKDLSDQHIIFSRSSRNGRILRMPFSSSGFDGSFPGGSWITEQLTLPFLIFDEGIDIFYSPSLKLPLRQPCKTIATINDAAPFLFPDEKTGGLENLLKQHITRAAARKANRIITSSHLCAKYLAESFKTGTDRISVVPPVVLKCYSPVFNYDKIEKEKEKHEIDFPYFIYSGSFKKRNNIKELLDLFRRYLYLKSDSGLVLVGPVDDEQKAFISGSVLSKRVVFIDKLPDEELALLFNGAAAFITASLFESCCNDALNACACGIPVIAYNNSSFPEILKNTAILVNAGDKNFFVKAMRDAKENQNLRLKMRALGIQHAKLFTPEKSAKALKAVFEEVRTEAYLPDAK